MGEPEDFPLWREWVWYAHLASDGDYCANYCKVCNFSTIRSFWQLWNNVLPVERIFFGDEYGVAQNKTVMGYSIFQEGIVPEWEDPRNREGSELCYRATLTAEELERVWRELTLLLIGYDECSALVYGIRLVSKPYRGVRNNFKVEIWLSDALQQTTSAVHGMLREHVPDLALQKATHVLHAESSTMDRQRTRRSRQ